MIDQINCETINLLSLTSGIFQSYHKLQVGYNIIYGVKQ